MSSNVDDFVRRARTFLDRSGEPGVKSGAGAGIDWTPVIPRLGGVTGVTVFHARVQRNW